MTSRKLTLIILVAILLAVVAIAPAKAETTGPIGSCPTGFTLMSVMQYDSMEHTHIGITVDLNQDGYLCMMEATPQLHVHVDDYLPLQ